MTIRIATARRNAMLNALTAAIDEGAAAGTIKIYSGAQPATADTAPTGTLLATFTLADPSFGAPVDGVSTLDANPVLVTTAVATGTPGWARAADSDGEAVFDGSVATSGADFIISSAEVTTGQTVNLTSGTLTIPA